MDDSTRDELLGVGRALLRQRRLSVIERTVVTRAMEELRAGTLNVRRLDELLALLRAKRAPQNDPPVVGALKIALRKQARKPSAS